jgi:hypothetical protein
MFDKPLKAYSNTTRRTGFGALILVIAGFSLFSTISYSPKLSSKTTNPALQRRQKALSFPQIYAADGILNCGSPLQPDQCTTASAASVSFSTTEETFPVHIASLFEYAVGTGAWEQLNAGPTITFQLDATVAFNVTYQVTIPPTPLFTRVATATNSYSPVISPTSALPASSSQSTTPTPKPTMRAIRRSYQFNLCDGVAPSHDFVSKSLVDVCRFVANAQQWFVSLRPSGTAAYLPCWPGYIVQTLIAIIDILAIVLPLRFPLTIESSIFSTPRDKEDPCVWHCT